MALSSAAPTEPNIPAVQAIVVVVVELVDVVEDVLVDVLLVELLDDVLVDVLEVLLVVELLVEVDVVGFVDVVVAIVEVVVVLVLGGPGQPTSAVGAVLFATILKSLFAGPVVGEFVTAPPAAPPKAIQYSSPLTIRSCNPPSVPGAGGTIVM